MNWLNWLTPAPANSPKTPDQPRSQPKFAPGARVQHKLIPNVPMIVLDCDPDDGNCIVRYAHQLAAEEWSLIELQLHAAELEYAPE